MLTDVQLERYADVLLWGLETARKEKFRKGDIVLIQYDAPALPLAELLYARILERGMFPVQRMGLTFRMERMFYEKSSGRQLSFIAPGERELLERVNGRIFLRAPESLTHLKEIDPLRIGKVLVARKSLKDILDRREEEGHYSWTLCTYPTKELAIQAKTAPKTYEKEIVRACWLDEEEPARKWDWIHREIGHIKTWLGGLPVKSFRIESASMDLTVTPGEQRKWVGISGHNIPSYEIFISPDWHGTEGTYYANLPSYRSGNYVEGVRLTFRKGVAVGIQADSGEEFARKQLAMDRGASRVGEFSLTDRRFSRIGRFMADTLFDENHGGAFGNCHVAVGSSYSDTYSGNPAELTKEKKKDLGLNDSALHWDLVNTEDKTVTARLKTGKSLVVYEGGVFKV
ncbi:MAG: aminopeptidase [Syntrophaceae bacterium]|nr:aminopeptidase [Syntrophaceae bacterium]